MSVDEEEIDVLDDENTSSGQAIAVSNGSIPFDSIMMELGDGVFVLDMENRIVFSNRKAASILGRDMSSLDGTGFHDLLADGSRLIWEGEMKRGSLENGEDLRVEMNTSEGITVSVLATMKSWKGDDGGNAGLMVTIRDMKDNDLSETRLKKEKERFRKILNSIQAGIVQVGTGTGIIEDLNPKACDLIGLTENILKGKDIADFISVEGEDIVFTREKKRSVMRVGTLKKNDGDLATIMTSSIRTELGGNESVIISFMDISDQTRSKATLEKMNELLRLINKILRHDMLNNLMIVTMGIEHYFDYGEDKLLKNSMLATNRSLELIRSMKELEFFLTDGGSLREYHIDKVALSIANNHPIKITVNGKATVMADEALSSLLDNLVTNAIKHGNADTVWITIKTGEDVVIDVADNGDGIPDELKTKVFREGFTTSKKSGTGIGLFIVERTVDRYGGTISVYDNEPKGSIFRIVLPVVNN